MREGERGDLGEKNKNCRREGGGGGGVGEGERRGGGKRKREWGFFFTQLTVIRDRLGAI